MSLRIRLLLAVGAVALAALGLAGVATYSSTRSYLNAQVDQTLATDCSKLGNVLTDGGRITYQVIGQRAPGAFVQIRSSTGQVVGTVPAVGADGTAISPKLPTAITLPTTSTPSSPPPSVPGRVDGGGFSPGNAGSGPSVLFTAASAAPGGPSFRVRVSALDGGYQEILAIPLTATAATLRHLALIEFLVAAAALVVAGLLGWWLVRAGLRPLRAVEATAGAIAAGGLSERVPDVGGPSTEVGKLAGAFNSMLDRIQGAFAARDATEDRLRRFVADASHELRTPLAAVAAYAELIDRGAATRPGDLERAVRGIRDEAGRMTGLVEDLLLLARLDGGRPLDRQPVELVSVVAQAVQAARAVGPEWPLRLDAAEPVEVTGDPDRLRQVFDNLLANTRAHTPPGTSVRVAVRREGPLVVAEIHDGGPGLDPERTAKIFERFYRAETSRSRHHGGSGLGLAIVASIVAAHQGTVSAASSSGAGMTIRISLPIRSEAADQ